MAATTPFVNGRTHTILPGHEDGDLEAQDAIDLPPVTQSAPVETPIQYAFENFADWAFVLGLAILLGLSEAFEPRHSYILREDLPKLSFPFYKHNTVPSWSVPLYSIVGVYVVILVGIVGMERLRTSRPISVLQAVQAKGLELNQLALAHLSSVFTTGLITNLLKNSIGRPRPNFLHRCWPDVAPVLVGGDDMGGIPECTGPAAWVAEGFKSFPSGHSSWSMAGLGFLSWWLLSVLSVADSTSVHVWRLLLAVSPMLAALAVGVTRVVDYWHHWEDVLVGLLLGLFISWLAFRRCCGRMGSNGLSRAGSPRRRLVDFELR